MWSRGWQPYRLAARCMQHGLLSRSGLAAQWASSALHGARFVLHGAQSRMEAERLRVRHTQDNSRLQEVPSAPPASPPRPTPAPPPPPASSLHCLTHLLLAGAGRPPHAWCLSRVARCLSRVARCMRSFTLSSRRSDIGSRPSACSTIGHHRRTSAVRRWFARPHLPHRPHQRGRPPRLVRAGRSAFDVLCVRRSRRCSSSSSRIQPCLKHN